ncbi:MAG: DUF3800 domain-containing protein [Ignavibacteria bacterium]|nr:DUF3800 domain-containing protein [Ignavibacteria bacterium]
MPELVELKYDLWERGLEFEYFHAAEDTQRTRDQVFEILGHHIGAFTVDSIVVEKRKTNPVLQQNLGRFYKKVLDILIRFLIQRCHANCEQIFVITDLLPIEKKRKELEKGIKTTLAQWTSDHQRTYHVFHYASKSDLNLQIIDYLNWAIYRKWERGDSRSYDLVRSCVRSEFEVFKSGTNIYY